jgi:phospho-N-acetylmuramoyl-pentapeptide-transferase
VSAAALILDLIAGRLANIGLSLTLPLLVCALTAAVLGSRVVPLLQWLKTGQVIREDGPQAHLKKAGTPTMGGVFFVPVGALLAVLWSVLAQTPDIAFVCAVCALTLAYGFIGWLDDWQILRRKSNKGISPKTKLALQIGFGVVFCLWAALSAPAAVTAITCPSV